MKSSVTSGKWWVCGLAPVLLVGCQSAQRVAGADSVTSIPGLTSAYYAVAVRRQDPHPSTRLPIRKARQRNFMRLASQSEKLLKDVEAWDSDARLTSVEEADRNEVRITVASFRDSLRNLSDAAAKSQKSDVREYYTAALASYRHLTAITESGD